MEISVPSSRANTTSAGNQVHSWAYSKLSMEAELECVYGWTDKVRSLQGDIMEVLICSRQPSQRVLMGQTQP